MAREGRHLVLETGAGCSGCSALIGRAPESDPNVLKIGTDVLNNGTFVRNFEPDDRLWGAYSCVWIRTTRAPPVGGRIRGIHGRETTYK